MATGYAMLDVSTLLEEIQASPYAEIPVTAPHSGILTFPVFPLLKVPLGFGKVARTVIAPVLLSN